MTFKALINAVLSPGLIVVLLAGEASADERPRALVEKLLSGHWVGQVDNTAKPYIFHTLNCTNGQFATAVLRDQQDAFIYFGSWDTDGETITHRAESSGIFDPVSLETLSRKQESFTNRYHLVELTETKMIYEWRDDNTLSFEAERTTLESGVSRAGLERLACGRPLPLS
ncbi:hypothetical protein J7443_06885 [Tropicibacter sp. R15_0]|uniref:hypothetical protein n=1 Tax=Tropicibacter sp. R15_0 TaxID=2821101 RepID=UPI001AD9E54E|nr:hypothetical protein [Tropicibacter sp. R15_0]MBO9464946.1 hypothetical protein [Tropicibacter sp. R15_0]